MGRKLLKKLAAVVLCVSVVAMFSGCSKSAATAKQPNPADITKKVITSDFPEMIEVKNDRLSKYYTIDDGAIKDFSLYICSSSASACEVAVFCAKDADSAAKIKEAVNDRIDDKKSVFENYGKPEEFQHIKDAVVETKGNYVLFAVTNDNKTAQKTMDSFF